MHIFRESIRKLDNRHKHIASPVSGKHVIEERAGKASRAMMTKWKVKEITRNFISLLVRFADNISNVGAT
jgi:hypothetical protein